MYNKKEQNWARKSSINICSSKFLKMKMATHQYQADSFFTGVSHVLFFGPKVVFFLGPNRKTKRTMSSGNVQANIWPNLGFLAQLPREEIAWYWWITIFKLFEELRQYKYLWHFFWSQYWKLEFVVQYRCRFCIWFGRRFGGDFFPRGFFTPGGQILAYDWLRAHLAITSTLIRPIWALCIWFRRFFQGAPP